MRYFLVESRAWLRKRLGELKHELKAANDAVEGYEASWDDPATDQVESAADVARIRRDKWIGRFTGELKRFAEDYWAISEGQRINIESRAELYVLAEMFDLLLAYVEDLADSWQQWFLNLEQVSREAKDRVAMLETMHDRSDDPTRVYVHASAAIKRKMWDEQSAQVAAMEFPPDVAREMYLALYRDLGETIRNETAAERSSGWVQELFDRSVLKWCQAQLRASPPFDMDVSAAIKSEWRMLRQAGGAGAPSTEDEAMMAYLGRIDSLATPWIDAGGKGQPCTYLCMHPDAAAKWSDKLLNQHARKRNVHAGFSRYRISRMAVLQALCATDLRSMVGEHATYRSAYDLRVQRSRGRPPAAVTPHLDFHWDSPAFLPELDDAEQGRAIRDIYRAALLTLSDVAAATSTQVFRMKLDLRQVWAWSPTRGVETALHDKDGHSVLADTYRLMDVLATNYGLVQQIVATAAEREVQIRSEPDKSNLIGRLGELVDAIARVPQEALSAAAGAQRQSALLQALFDEVYEIYHRASRLPDSARLAAQGTLQGIWQWSSALSGDSGLNVPANGGAASRIESFAESSKSVPETGPIAPVPVARFPPMRLTMSLV